MGYKLSLSVLAFICILFFLATSIHAQNNYFYRFPLEGDLSPSQDFSVWNSVWKGYHLAEDIVRDPNTSVYPIGDGVVKYADIILGYTVIIEYELPPGDPDGEAVCSVYYHLKRPEDGGIPLTVGTPVSMLNPIGYISGRWEDHQSVPHLHFGIRKGRYRTGTDPRTEKWYYPGYTTIYKNDVLQNDSNDPVHQEILSEWCNPTTDSVNGTGFLERHTIPSILNQSVYPYPNTASPGDVLTMVCNISNPTSNPIPNVRLGTRIRLADPQGEWIDDPAHDEVKTLVVGKRDYSRSFRIPDGIPEGLYDVGWLILDHDTGEWIDSKESSRILRIIPSITRSPKSPWAMLGQDSQHTGLSPYLGVQTSNLKWVQDLRLDFSSYSYDALALAPDGTVYLGAGWMYEGKLHAISPDGSLKWSYDTGSCPTAPAIGSEGTIYVGEMDFGNYLYAINSDGSLKWKYYIGDAVYGVTVGPDGTVYFTSETGFLYALNPDGTLKWSYNSGQWTVAHSIPTLAPDGTVYIAHSVGYHGAPQFYSLDSDGSVNWQKSIGCRGCSTGTAVIGSNGTIYVTIGAGGLYALSPNGKIIWGGISMGYRSSTPAIGPDNTIYVGVYDARSPAYQGFQGIKAVNPDGTIRWSYPVENGVDNSPIIGSDGTIYFGEYNGDFHALYPDGILKWSYPLGSYYSYPAIDYDGTLYVSAGGRLYAFGSTTGLLPDTINLLRPDSELIQSLYSSVDPGRIKIFDTVRNTPGALEVLLNWSGSEMQLKVYDPNGDLYEQQQSTTPPITMEIDNARPGTWTMVVDGVDVPEDNYSFALVVGTKPKTPFAYSTGAYFIFNHYRATAALDVKYIDGSASGWLKFNYRSRTQTVYMNSTQISSITLSAENAVVIQGDSKVNNQEGYSFTAVVTDSASPGGGSDRFSTEITGPNNYSFSASGTLGGGDLKAGEE